MLFCFEWVDLVEAPTDSTDLDTGLHILFLYFI